MRVRARVGIPSTRAKMKKTNSTVKSLCLGLGLELGLGYGQG